MAREARRTTPATERPTLRRRVELSDEEWKEIFMEHLRGLLSQNREAALQFNDKTYDVSKLINALELSEDVSNDFSFAAYSLFREFKEAALEDDQYIVYQVGLARSRLRQRELMERLGAMRGQLTFWREQLIERSPSGEVADLLCLTLKTTLAEFREKFLTWVRGS